MSTKSPFSIDHCLAITSVIFSCGLPVNKFYTTVALAALPEKPFLVRLVVSVLTLLLFITFVNTVNSNKWRLDDDDCPRHLKAYSEEKFFVFF